MSMIAPHWLPQSEWDALPQYVAGIAAFLCLRDWRFVIDFDGADGEECEAKITPAEGCKFARLTLGRDWAKRSREEKRHTIAHELIHCHLAGATGVVRYDTIKHLAQSTYDVLWASFLRHLEYGVDGLADAVAPLLPAYPEVT